MLFPREMKFRIIIPALFILNAVPITGSVQYQIQSHRMASQEVRPVVFVSSQRESIDTNEAAQKLFQQIQNYISNNEVKNLSPYFASKVYISLLSGKQGYFSSEQSYFILKNFFLTYTPISFSFSNTSTENANPYGVGTLHYMHRGQRSKAQLFVSLSRSQNKWRISQITIANR